MQTPAHRLVQANASSSSSSSLGPALPSLFSAPSHPHNQPFNHQQFVAQILREATLQERAKLATSSSSGQQPQQVGWHTHATHVFAIPFNVVVAATTGVDAADASTQTVTAPPLLPAPQQQQPPSMPAPTAPDLPAAFPQQQQQNPLRPPPVVPPPQVTVPRGLRVVVFHPPPTVPASDCGDDDNTSGETAAWWRSHPEYAQWVWETENVCYGERRIDRILRTLDLARHILARWDHYAREFRAAHDYTSSSGRSDCRSWMWRAPPAYAPDRRNATSVADLARIAAAAAAASSSSSSSSSARGSRYPRKQSADFTYCAWTSVLLIVLFIVVAVISNWAEVTVRYPHSGEMATAAAYFFLGLLSIALLYWAVGAYCFMASSDDGGDRVAGGDDGYYYYGKGA